MHPQALWVLLDGSWHMPSSSTAAATAAASAARRTRAAQRAAADPELRARAVRVVHTALSTGELDFLEVVPPPDAERSESSPPALLAPAVLEVRAALANGELNLRDLFGAGRRVVETRGHAVEVRDAR